MEYREYRAEGVTSSDDGVMEGLVTPFRTETTIGDLSRGGWREDVGDGCFTKTLSEGDPLMVWQHNLAMPLARKSAGNLDLHEGSFEGQDGLVLKAKPVDTTYAQDMRKLIDAKVVRGMSFGFQVVKDEWRDDNGNPSDKFSGTRRTLREVKLIEVSPVTRPAYGGTSIMARDEASAILEARAAKATYADLETCGECGATGQYGAYCTGCGEPMRSSKPAGDFCSSCGAAIDDGDRSAHQCDEARASNKPYGNVAYADPKNGKYPIDQKHVKAAWSYINQAKNAAKYPLNGVSLASVKAKIKAAMKKFGFTSGSAGEEKNFEFVSAEWRDDDPYFDGWYEIDADPEDGDDAEETSGDSRDQEPDSSTPNPEDDNLALRMTMRRREIELDSI